MYEGVVRKIRHNRKVTTVGETSGGVTTRGSKGGRNTFANVEYVSETKEINVSALLNIRKISLVH